MEELEMNVGDAVMIEGDGVFQWCGIDPSELGFATQTNVSGVSILIPTQYLNLAETDQQEQLVQITDSESSLVQELLQEPKSEPDYYVCSVCLKRFRSKTEYQSHYETHRGKEFICEDCGDSFNVAVNLKLHAALHNFERLECPECKRVFSRIASFKNHLQLHKEEDTVVCGECGDEFAYPSHLAVHRENHHAGVDVNGSRSLLFTQSYPCHLCNKVFPSKATLQVHKSKHEATSLAPSGSTLYVRRRRRKTERRSKYECGVCHKKFLKPSILRRHEIIHTGEKPFQCTECKASFNQKGTLRLHMSKHSGFKPFMCNSCGLRFSQKGNLITHTVKTHAAALEGVDVHQCPECSCTFRTTGSLHCHMTRFHENLPPVTTVCSQDDILQKALRDSGLTDKPVSDSGKEQVILLTESDSQVDGTVKQHRVWHRFDGKFRWYQCETCEKEFRKPSDLLRHRRIHTREKPFKCPHCYRTFAIKTTLNNHMNTHAPGKGYECRVCKKELVSSRSLQSHMISHSGHKLFYCALCSRRFVTGGQLRVHQRTKLHRSKLCPPPPVSTVVLPEPHIDLGDGNIQPVRDQRKVNCINANPEERPYECQECQLRFRRPNHLKYHNTQHTGLRPYQCSKCPKRFSKTSVLKMHQRTHLDVKEFTCPDCCSQFSTRGSLRRHMATFHSEERRFICPLCQKRFKTAVTCKKHIRTHQNIGSSVLAQTGPEQEEYQTFLPDETGIITLPSLTQQNIEELEQTLNNQMMTHQLVSQQALETEDMLVLNQATEEDPLTQVVLSAEPERHLAHSGSERNQMSHVVLNSEAEKNQLSHHLVLEPARNPLNHVVLNSEQERNQLRHIVINAQPENNQLGHVVFNVEAEKNQNFRHVLTTDLERNHIVLNSEIDRSHLRQVLNVEPERNHLRHIPLDNETESRSLRHVVFNSGANHLSHAVFNAETENIDRRHVLDDSTSDIRRVILHGEEISSDMGHVVFNADGSELSQMVITGDGNELGHVVFNAQAGGDELILETEDNPLSHLVLNAETGENQMTHVVLNRDRGNKQLVQVVLKEEQEKDSPDSIHVLVGPEEVLAADVKEDIDGTVEEDFTESILFNADVGSENQQVSITDANNMGMLLQMDFPPEEDVKEQNAEQNQQLNAVGNLFQVLPSSSRVVQTNERSHSGKKKERLDCDKCLWSSTSERALVRHIVLHQMMDKHRGQTDVMVSRPRTKRVKGPIKKFSPEETRELAELVDNPLASTSEQILAKAAAQIVGKKTKRKVEAKKRFRCVTCQKCFGKMSDLERHKRVHTGERPFGCNICHKQFRIKSTLICHLNTHEKRQPIHCHVCSAVLSCKSSLAVHMRLHTGVLPFQCELCQERFRTSGHLKVHVESHNNGKVQPQVKTMSVEALKEIINLIAQGFEVQLPDEKDGGQTLCLQSVDTCTFRSADEVALPSNVNNAVHVSQEGYVELRTADGQTLRVLTAADGSQSAVGTQQDGPKSKKERVEHACTTCGKIFSKNSLLVRHMRVHSGERPFACTECPQTFNQKTALLTHNKVHEGVRPFPCPYCTYSSTQKSNLRAHVSRIHQFAHYLELDKKKENSHHVESKKDTIEQVAAEETVVEDLNMEDMAGADLDQVMGELFPQVT